MNNQAKRLDNGRLTNDRRDDEIVNRIKELRESRDLSAEQLAKLVGTSQPQITRLENGERRLTAGWMRRIAKPLGVKPADLIMEDDGLARAIASAGSARALAKRLGLSAQAVHQWLRVPADRCVEIERLTGVPRSDLRPDIFRVPEREAHSGAAEVRELITFMNDWRARHDLRNSEVRQIVAVVLAEQFPQPNK